MSKKGWAVYLKNGPKSAVRLSKCFGDKSEAALRLRRMQRRAPYRFQELRVAPVALNALMPRRVLKGR